MLASISDKLLWRKNTKDLLRIIWMTQHLYGMQHVQLKTSGSLPLLIQCICCSVFHKVAKCLQICLGRDLLLGCSFRIYGGSVIFISYYLWSSLGLSFKLSVSALDSSHFVSQMHTSKLYTSYTPCFIKQIGTLFEGLGLFELRYLSGSTISFC